MTMQQKALIKILKFRIGRDFSWFPVPAKLAFVAELTSGGQP